MTTPHVRRYAAETRFLLVAGLGLAVAGAVRAFDMSQPVTLILGDHAFSPAHVEVEAGRPVVLTLSNHDAITPHNFTLRDPAAGLDIDADVGAGTSVVVEFTPRVAGTYSFYCNKKLPFMKSHRARGMEGTLTVTGSASE